jgi:hypothetical protein
MVTRRGIVLTGLGVVALVGVGALGADLLTEHEIVALVRRRLNFLKLDDAGLHSFARDQIASILAKRPTWGRVKFHIRSMFAKPAARYGFSTDRRTRTEHMADNLSTLYLLSSDFFVNGADESASVQYVSLYDPMRACSNPFARPAVSPKSAA